MEQCIRFVLVTGAERGVDVTDTRALTHDTPLAVGVVAVAPRRISAHWQRVWVGCVGPWGKPVRSRSTIQAYPQQLGQESQQPRWIKQRACRVHIRVDVIGTAPSRCLVVSHQPASGRRCISRGQGSMPPTAAPDHGRRQRARTGLGIRDMSVPRVDALQPEVKEEGAMTVLVAPKGGPNLVGVRARSDEDASSLESQGARTAVNAFRG